MKNIDESPTRNNEKKKNNISGIIELFTQTIPLPIAWF